jgi:hypothetical protein
MLDSINKLLETSLLVEENCTKTHMNIFEKWLNYFKWKGQLTNET